MQLLLTIDANEFTSANRKVCHIEGIDIQGSEYDYRQYHPQHEDHHRDHECNDHDGRHSHAVDVNFADKKNSRLRNGLVVGALGSFALAYMNRHGVAEHGTSALQSASTHEIGDGIAHTVRLGASYLGAWGYQKGERGLRRAAGAGVITSGVIAGIHAFHGLEELIENPSDALKYGFTAGRYAVTNAVGNLAMAGVLIRSSLGTVLQHDIGDHSENDAQEGFGTLIGTAVPVIGDAMVADAAASNAYDGARRVHNPDYKGGHNHDGKLARMKNALFGGITKHSLKATMWTMDQASEGYHSLSRQGRFAAAGLGVLTAAGGFVIAQQEINSESVASVADSDLHNSPASEPFIIDVSEIDFTSELPAEHVPYESADIEVLEALDYVELESYDHETKDGTVWNIAHDIAGPEASTAEVNDIKNAILKHNNLTEQQARGLSPGFRVVLPAGL